MAAILKFKMAIEDSRFKYSHSGMVQIY